MSTCRVPEEGSALVFAWLAVLLTIVWLVLIPAFVAPAYLILVILLVPVFYAIGRYREAELTGHGVEVTPINYPLVHARVEHLKARLDAADLRIRVFIVNSGDYNAGMERYGSRRMLVLNGKLLDDMPAPQCIAELDFLIGRFIGGFRLRQLRFGPLLFLIAVRRVPGVGLLLKPWYRASVLTGDRAGILACGNVDAAFSAMAKLSVGPEGIDGYSLVGHLDQTKRAQHGVFYTLYRWTSDFPHLTDRVSRLMKYAISSTAVSFPTGSSTVIGDLDEAIRVA